MKDNLKIVVRYIKSYKARSLAIALSIILATSLIVGIGTLSRSAQQADVDRMKRETGADHVYFKNVKRNQLKSIKSSKDIKNLGITSYYASTDVNEKLPINILHANKNYLTSHSKLIKGRFPKASNEVVVEKWILNSMGLKPETNQDLTFKLYQKENPETFKVVGILEDRFIEKQKGMCEIFLNLNESKLDNFTTYIEFNEDSNINTNIDNIAKNAILDKESVRRNSMLIESTMKNGTLDDSSKYTAIAMSLFSGIVIYSIYVISIYQRIQEYGVLRAIGSTNFRIFKLMFYELFILALIAMPIGICTGMGGAQIFNRSAGNIQFEGNIKVTPFVIPDKIILLSIASTILIILIISFFTYLKIRRISPIDAIRKTFGTNKNVTKVNSLISKLTLNISVTKSISAKNIFRNKKGFIIIILSMSIGGIIVIKDNYKSSFLDVQNKSSQEQTYMNADFILSNTFSNETGNNTSFKDIKGFNDNQIDKIKNIDGIDKVKTASILNTRIEVDKINRLDYYEAINSTPYYKEYPLFTKNNTTGKYTLKQKLRGYNDEMIKSLEKYLVSGNINLKKMKKENLAIVYVPEISKTKKYQKTFTHGKGTPVVDIKVGDTIKVKYPNGRIDMDLYESQKDNYEYLEYEFKVGAIVNYPFADSSTYSGDDGVDVITSSEYLKKLTGVDKYNLVYADLNENANSKKINKLLGKIGSEVSGTTTIDMMVEKENSDKMTSRSMIYNYGIVAIMFIISVLNIINNISYNLTSRTSEFGMLRAIGISEREFKNMILYEGILYGVLSSIITIVSGLIIQFKMYYLQDFASYGLDFTIDYKIYILVVLANIIVGILATCIPSRKINKISIVEAINITE
ncbi:MULTISPECIES: FtsX-like permease family protein [unclassified Clostridioides]|uniref:ABC transporter permease n=1 Tax=unclassified Clostridioides TaxID=2635829 RepID=UPI001D112AC6|nr:FtsX-like permease family protein [Clostridioides sp. ZZV14-6150]MCC0661853.1 FtsX-like permease family protein [Clostridioides sp. ZZV14-6154]MCC0669651.1 FtsX-like permease family protein [Clostridioides sp. ZZV14-6153]MCC0723617.1 FtsX-like permease family protein [Clostridioides sp. ZZV14-6104]MCC0727014.1 FtsX-like permease family protein [Clostridioides sp. ZZV14-6045]MCC0740095.1 FtsX-like permease family protein [Clostridioides sp. ZZV14-5902]MCC0743512.1 FtsX-like permease family 